LDEDGVSTDAEYFIGSIVVCPRGVSLHEVIDGQQRLTTCYLINCVVRDIVEAKGDTPSSALERMIADTELGDDGQDMYRYRLQLQYADARNSLAKIADSHGQGLESIQRTTDSIKHILEAYDTIHTYLNEKFGGDTDQIRKFHSAFCGKVKLIRIVTPNLSMALKVFETINDRGVGLNAMDLLKNLLFMSISDSQHDELKSRWKELSDLLNNHEKPLRFLRYFVMANYKPDFPKPIREDQIYGWISDPKSHTEVREDPVGFLELMLDNARAYVNFISGNDATGKQNRYLKNLKVANGQQRLHMILLLAGRHLGAADFDYLASNLENLIFCFNVTRTRTNYLESQVGNWSELIRESLNRTDLDAKIIPLWQKEMADRSSDFDREFGQIAVGRIQKYRLRYILAKFAQYLNVLSFENKEDYSLDKFLDRSNDIEHILPETPTAEYRSAFDKSEDYDDYKQRIGNLTLLEHTINASLGNGVYDSKESAYRASQYVLTNSVFEVPAFGTNTRLHKAASLLPQSKAWDSAAIERRGVGLVNLARLVWGMPTSKQSS
jgi:hypothetical protein